MQRILNYVISAIQAGTSVGHFLRDNGYSHHIIVHLKKLEDGIMVNNVHAYTNQILQEDDCLTINIDERTASLNIEAINIPIDIVYEDDDIMVINKPSGMPVHPSQGNHDNTLANGVAYYFASQGIPYTYRCINRLDRDTTGLLVLAKNMLSAAILSQKMKERQINRTYFALVEGCPPQRGTVNAPIGRKDDSTIERQINYEKGDNAITHYHRLETVNNISLVELHLETGRTHQIRVHMKHLGHPLVGDFLYNPTSQLLSRQALHSHQLSFNHPLTNELMTFTCPLPDDFKIF